MELSKVSGNPILISEALGCVFTMMFGELFMTPQFIDDSWDDDEDTWIEVDHLSLLAEEQYIQDEVDRCEALLRLHLSQDTPLAESYGG